MPPRSVVALLVALTIAAAACSPVDGAAVRPDPASQLASPVAQAAPTGEPTSEPSPSPATAPTPAAATATPAPTPAPTLEPEPTPKPDPKPDPKPKPAARPPRPYAINLAMQADFVPQYTFEWCVGASIQMARSIIDDNRNESRTSQRRLWQMARDRTIGSPYGGANPAGWAAALTDLGLGHYRLVSLPSFDAAVDRAALAIRRTGRPVGLVMWAGRHAWVMTGFEATADPRKHRDARVTRVRVMDPLYPHGSRWGRSPEPNSLIRRQTLARQFVERNRPDYDFGVTPGWLLVLPVD